MIQKVHIVKLGFLLLSILFFTNCNKDVVSNELIEVEPIENPITTIDPVTSTGEENYLSLDSDYLFDQEKLPTFELTIKDEDYSAINNNPVAEKYVEASLTFEGETISPIGVRYKGSIGSFVDCVSGGNWANPSGYKTCTKLSMKIKINWEGREEKFYGVKKIQLHSMNQDPSQMRDRLGYWLFSEMGVPSPRAIHAKLMINGEYAGLFMMIEQIDGRFTRYHLDDDEGNVYKEIWPLTDQGKLHADFQYRAALKTNENENANIDIIKGLAIDIDQAPDENGLKDAITKWMDVDKVISYAMVDRAIRHDDGPFHWYCFGGCSPHNFYFIEEPNKQKIHLIPWDLDNAFENITQPNTVTNIQDGWGQTSNNCNPYSSGLFGIEQRSAACDNLVYGMSLFTEEYDQKKQIFNQGPFSQSSINLKIDTWADQIRDATQEATIQHNDALGINQWNSEMDKLKQQCQIARTQ